MRSLMPYAYEVRCRQTKHGTDVSGGINMTSRLTKAAYVLSFALSGAALTSGPALAQTPAQGSAAMEGTPSGEHIQPWGLPPPPPGIGPVSLFADIHDQPQGKFLEGGAFDEAG